MRTTLRLLSLSLCGAVATSAYAGSYDNIAVDEGIQELPFKVNVDIRGGYDTNVNTSSGAKITDSVTGDVIFSDDKIDSWFTGADIKFTKDFGGPRTKFTLGLGAGFTYFFDLPADDMDYNFRLDTTLDHKFSRKFGITAYATAAYLIEPNFFDTSVLTNSRRNGHYLYANAGFSLNYQWRPKFSTRTGYQFSALRYDDTGVADLENRIQQLITQEFRFLVLPTTTLIAEYRFGWVDYETNPRNSTSNYALVGFEHTFNPRFTLSLRGGAEWRSYDVGGNQTKPYGEGTLSYAYGESSRLSLVARYGIENSDNLLTDNVTFRTGIRLVQGLTPKLSANLSFYYQNSQHDGPFGDYTDNLYQLNAGLTYAISRMFNVGVYYSYTEQASDIATQEYDRSRYSFGGGMAF